MHDFIQIIETVDLKYQRLLKTKPYKIDTLPKKTPVGGVYMFSEGECHLYVGRTQRPLKIRIKEHVSTKKDCPFAWRLARVETGYLSATYAKKGSRKDLIENNSEFKLAYSSAKDRIREMDVRFIEESDPVKQALLEIYVAVKTNAKHNSFSTH